MIGMWLVSDWKNIPVNQDFLFWLAIVIHTIHESMLKDTHVKGLPTGLPDRTLKHTEYIKNFRDGL